jgi:hypothetical protein
MANHAQYPLHRAWLARTVVGSSRSKTIENWSRMSFSSRVNRPVFAAAAGPEIADASSSDAAWEGLIACTGTRMHNVAQEVLRMVRGKR